MLIVANCALLQCSVFRAEELACTSNIKTFIFEKWTKIASVLNTGKQILPLWAALLMLWQTELDLWARAKSHFHYIKSPERCQYTPFPISPQTFEGNYSDVTTNSSAGIGGWSALCLALITRRMDIVWNVLLKQTTDVYCPWTTNGFSQLML